MTTTSSPDRMASAQASAPDVRLGGLREDIDRIDAAMHALLIERSEVIDRLIAIKTAAGGGSAFRPAREADMMRRLVARHRGLLPLDTVESIWRVIISTFTYVQAAYRLHAAVGGVTAAVRDSARFHFGFTVPLVEQADAAAVLAAVAASDGDLGLLPVAGDGVWWELLVAPDAPKIIARVPFIVRADHPAGLPLYIVAQPLAEAASQDVILYAGRASLAADEIVGALRAIGGTRVASEGDAVLVAASGDVAPDRLAAALVAPGAPLPVLRRVGSHASPCTVPLDPAVAA